MPTIKEELCFFSSSFSFLPFPSLSLPLPISCQCSTRCVCSCTLPSLSLSMSPRSPVFAVLVLGLLWSPVLAQITVTPSTLTPEQLFDAIFGLTSGISNLSVEVGLVWRGVAWRGVISTGLFTCLFPVSPARADQRQPRRHRAFPRRPRHRPEHRHRPVLGYRHRRCWAQRGDWHHHQL